MTEKKTSTRKKSPSRPGRAKFGVHRIPFSVKEKDFEISVEKKRGCLHYRRTCKGDDVTRTIFSSSGEMIIHPVEPVNTPKRITSIFMVEFQDPLRIDSGTARKFYCRFPVEIGVFVKGKGNPEIIDIFTLSHQKYTLYGDLITGVISRYRKSEIHTSVPSADVFREGILELNLKNASGKWVELTKAVFNACGMTLHFDEKMVSMRAKIKITDDKYAVTSFIDAPLKKGMKKSIELYTPNTVSIFTPKFSMEGEL